MEWLFSRKKLYTYYTVAWSTIPKQMMNKKATLSSKDSKHFPEAWLKKTLMHERKIVQRKLYHITGKSSAHSKAIKKVIVLTYEKPNMYCHSLPLTIHQH